MPPEKVNVRNVYYPHKRVQFHNDGPSMTQQNFRDETNINLILAKYAKTGLLDHVNKYGGQYADMPDQDDYQGAMNLVMEAQSMFEELPSGIRAKFENDPGQFLDFVDDPLNRDEAIEMGLFPSPAPAVAPTGETPPIGDLPPPEPVTAPPEAPPGESER